MQEGFVLLTGRNPTGMGSFAGSDKEMGNSLRVGGGPKAAWLLVGIARVLKLRPLGDRPMGGAPSYNTF